MKGAEAAQRRRSSLEAGGDGGVRVGGQGVGEHGTGTGKGSTPQQRDRNDKGREA